MLKCAKPGFGHFHLLGESKLLQRGAVGLHSQEFKFLVFSNTSYDGGVGRSCPKMNGVFTSFGE